MSDQEVPAEHPVQEPAADDQPEEPEAAEPAQGPEADEDGEPLDPTDSTDSTDLSELKAIVEALLFSTDRPVSVRRLSEAAGTADGRQVRAALKELKRQYDEGGHAFSLEEIAGGFQMLTRPEYAPWIGRLNTQQRQETLSKAALETLAVGSARQLLAVVRFQVVPHARWDARNALQQDGRGRRDRRLAIDDLVYGFGGHAGAQRQFALRHTEGIDRLLKRGSRGDGIVRFVRVPYCRFSRHALLRAHPAVGDRVAWRSPPRAPASGD